MISIQITFRLFLMVCQLTGLFTYRKKSGVHTQPWLCEEKTKWGGLSHIPLFPPISNKRHLLEHRTGEGQRCVNFSDVFGQWRKIDDDVALFLLDNTDLFFPVSQKQGGIVLCLLCFAVEFKSQQLFSIIIYSLFNSKYFVFYIFFPPLQNLNQGKQKKMNPKMNRINHTAPGVDSFYTCCGPQPGFLKVNYRPPFSVGTGISALHHSQANK